MNKEEDAYIRGIRHHHLRRRRRHLHSHHQLLLSLLQLLLSIPRRFAVASLVGRVLLLPFSFSIDGQHFVCATLVGLHF